MAENRNFAALDWVVNEIAETLKEARQSLESYVQDTNDKSRLRFCLTHIHQVRGSLLMVEFHGAAMLAEEMELLTQAMINDGVDNLGEGAEVLMRAILQFPIYLDQVKSSRRDNPLVVLPLLNDLRTVRGESLLSDTNLFMPDLSSAKNVSGERIELLKDDAQFKATVQKLRQMYQYAAAGFIKSVNADENLAYLQKVFQRLYRLTSGTARQSLWKIAIALAEALEMDAVESSVSIKNLLRRLDREIKVLAVHGTKALQVFTDDELLKNLLYYVARSGKHAPGFSAGSFLKQVYDQYQLESALLEGKEGSDADGVLSSPDPDAIRSVVKALKVELDGVKQALDLSLSASDKAKPLQDAVAIIRRVGDTMAILGIGDLRRVVLDQGAAIELALDGGAELSPDQLMAVAARIIDIEGELDVLAANAGKSPDKIVKDQAGITLSDAKASVMRESRNGLEHAKDAIVEYIASQWNREHLTNVPQMLRDIRGSLEIVPLPRPGRILSACARYIEEQLLKNELTPEWSTLDTLADAITSVEYYLERLGGESSEEENDLLLLVAEESVAELGYAVARHSGVNPDNTQDDLPPEEQDLGETSADDLAQLQQAYAQAGLEAQDNNAGEDLSPPSYEAETIELESIADNVVEPDTGNTSGQEALDEVGSLGEGDDDSAGVESTSAAIADEASSKPAAETTESTPASAAQDDDEDDIDDEILEIFVEEAGEVTEAINEYFPRWAQNFDDSESLTEFRRAFHTLKGSGRMVGASDIGELAWAVENMLNRVLDGTVVPGNEHVTFIENVRVKLPGLIDAFAHKQPTPELDLINRMREQGDQLSHGEMPYDLKPLGAFEPAAEEQSSQEPSPETSADASVVEEEMADDDDGQLWDIFGSEAKSHLRIVQQYIDRMDEARPLFEPPSDDMQRALHTLKGSAHMADITPIAELATPLEKFVKELRSYQVNINDDILQLLRDGVSYTHAALAELFNDADVVIPKLEQYLARVAELREIYVAPLAQMQEGDANGKRPVDPELLAIFMAEEMNLLLDADELVNAWQQNPEHLDQLRPMVEELKNLTRGAAHANLPPMASLGDKLHQVYVSILAERLSCQAQLCEDLNRIHTALLDMVDAVAAGQNLRPIPPAIDAAIARWLEDAQNTSSLLVEPEVEDSDSDIVDDLAEHTDFAAAIEEGADSGSDVEPNIDVIDQLPADPESENSSGAIASDAATDTNEPDQHEEPDVETVSVDDELPTPEVEQLGEEDESIEIAEAEESASATSAATDDFAKDVEVEDELDEEILDIFMEEADELNEDIERALHDWQEDWSNTDCLEELKRSLHTLKGGARLAGLTELGDLTHEFETKIIEMNVADMDEAVFAQLVSYQDRIHHGVQVVRAKLNGEALPSAPVQTPSKPAAEPSEDAGQPPTPATSESAEQGKVLPFAPKPKPEKPQGVSSGPDGGGQVATTGAQAQHLAAKRSGPQEVVKVSAELLEELVNLAGETSIARSRVEEQVGDVGTALDEMDSTIERLQEQLRRLDIETEAQIIFRQEQMAQHEDFDPLEMDRYSALQQLSRSLVESASDLLDLRLTLADKTRDTETLLLQQSRINTDLQEGLMRSRMVPFSRLVPRLRRIVRQAATELGKDVSFELDNVEGELDRSVLERMIAPLEHMLRNAVDHGIEPKDDRVAAGKNETGRISLNLSREGGDVVLRLVDDGRGINLERVRAKAIERGLMTEEAQLSDQDIMQFILHAGFSTADKVTQISGRGVGMDVVHSEIKQLGGAMFIASRWGEGTEFTVRLPFTVSVNRALMVQIGEDHYAIPLNTIEGIVRVSPFELEHYYQDESARFEYASEHYLVRYLGSLLDSDSLPKLDGQALPLPVILVRSAENTVALQVDRLMGSREIVVKTLGAQFSAVRGVSGATVMGDGSVVVILDLHALIREQLALGLAESTLLEPFAPKESTVEEEEEKTVMVVDDSVTVRKVTGRFLEREGYNVITAKDGAEAILLLQDHIPDVMLLDIEMPRMDGFEVAKNIRTSSRLKHLPIIMITSRTGEKHRERALALGVNRYMGKPYQEDLLLTNIQQLTEESEDE
ncbi:Hpt domain-containing protein [Gilvimarinus sp. SDUM040013]|uniref:histidine kinase n=1 Tax=Gilvimarinus gilvus TaxID=3058038 RepID=A0ABU4S165_9GAMM|nr:Hpt domain-containing protein [Gilvimarinus sp. SDUM040013]MDO3387584.1 Hpt domain-containing protein [Gilvimarinus sp. SDUM040013]MDX6850151.1 Hpt domain-containing protein [Gilvimarinus sp. SDUM040013]